MEKLGHYRIHDTLGEGAMGIVYRAVDERLDRTVALKVLRLHLSPAERSEYAARLQQEARSAARLNHAGIITMYDCGDENDHAYLAMEFVEGKTLQSLLDQGVRLPLNRVLKLADQLFAALAYAHEHDVVHRDIKPANLMLKADGRLKITDFGIAQLPASELTRTGTIVGSPRHMAPEQIEGKKLDGRADVFAAGIVLYEVLTGKRPFDGEHMASIAYKILHETPADIRTLNPSAPDWLVDVVMRCLEKDPAARFANARDARNALRDLQLAKADHPASAAADITAQPAASTPPHRSIKPMLIAAIAGFAALGLGYAWFNADPTPTEVTIAADVSKPEVISNPASVPTPIDPATAPLAAESQPPVSTRSISDAAPASIAASSLDSPSEQIPKAQPALQATPRQGKTTSVTNDNKGKSRPKPASKPSVGSERSPAPNHANGQAAKQNRSAESQATPQEQPDAGLWQRITGCDSTGNCPTSKKRETRDR